MQFTDGLIAQNLIQSLSSVNSLFYFFFDNYSGAPRQSFLSKKIPFSTEVIL